MRVAVTGIDGFTGQYIARALEAAGHDVAGIRQSKSESPVYGEIADLLNPDAIENALSIIKPDAIIHLAAISSVDHDDISAFERVNVEGTQNLLDAAASMKGNWHRIILASSANIYGDAHSGAISEQAAPAPVNEYARSKLAMEGVAQSWMASLPITITRPFNYTGVGQSERFLIAKIVNHFKKREAEIRLGNLEVARDFCDVRDVANAYVQLLSADSIGKTVNICSGRAYILQDVVDMTARFSDHNIKVIQDPTFMRPNDIRLLYGDCGLLKSLLGDWNPRDLDKTISWMLKSK